MLPIHAQPSIRTSINAPIIYVVEIPFLPIALEYSCQPIKLSRAANIANTAPPNCITTAATSIPIMPLIIRIINIILLLFHRSKTPIAFTKIYQSFDKFFFGKIWKVSFCKPKLSVCRLPQHKIAQSYIAAGSYH